jgi:hypothetical protein
LVLVGVGWCCLLLLFVACSSLLYTNIAKCTIVPIANTNTLFRLFVVDPVLKSCCRTVRYHLGTGKIIVVVH